MRRIRRGPWCSRAIAATTRVCAYDRPGTYASVGDQDFVSRSDPVPQPTTAQAVVTDLHALLHAAGVPGPYVLAGHSLGGFISRMYASTYPDEVVGMVLLDAYSEFLEPIIGPKLWPKLVKLNACERQARADSGLRRQRGDSVRGAPTPTCAN